MDNITVTNQSSAEVEKQCASRCEQIFEEIWLTGIAASCLGLLLQTFLLVLISSCRKFDEKVLIHIAVSRTMNTICEYYYTYHIMGPEPSIFYEPALVLIFHTDLMIACWMFVFTKNIYNKVVLVFSNHNWSVYAVAISIWHLTLLIGLINLFILKIFPQYYEHFYNAYCIAKFLIAIINIGLFLRIFAVVATRGPSTGRSLKDVIKTSVMAFTLVLTNGIQVLTTDLLSFFIGYHEILINIFFVINSFQVIPVTAIFLILLRGKIKGPILQTVSFRLKEHGTSC